MRTIFRSLMFIGVFCLYAALVFDKGVGAVTTESLVLFFGLNVYFFIPIQVAAHGDGDDGNFLEMMSEGDSVEQIDRLLMAAALFALITLFGTLLNTSNFILGLLVFAVTIFLFKKFLVVWFEITIAPLEAFQNGNMFEKMSLVVSFVGMIAFATVASGYAYMGAGIVMIQSIIMIIAYSPILPLLIIAVINSSNTPFANVELPEPRELAMMYVAVLYISTLSVQIPVVNFAINIPHELLQIVSILASVPAMFTLSRIVVSAVVDKKKMNYMITSGIMALFYGGICVTSLFYA